MDFEIARLSVRLEITLSRIVTRLVVLVLFHGLLFILVVRYSL